MPKLEAAAAATLEFEFKFEMPLENGVREEAEGPGLRSTSP